VVVVTGGVVVVEVVASIGATSGQFVLRCVDTPVITGGFMTCVASVEVVRPSEVVVRGGDVVVVERVRFAKVLVVLAGEALR
jgi:hypothetical protein